MRKEKRGKVKRAKDEEVNGQGKKCEERGTPALCGVIISEPATSEMPVEAIRS